MEMNSVKVCEKPPKRENFRFGMSPLHGYISTFEYLLHILYRLSFKSWQAKGEDNEKLLKIDTTRIIQYFKAKMGLVVATP